MTFFAALTHTPPRHSTFLVSLRGVPSHLLRSLLPFLSSLSTSVLHPFTPPTGFHLFWSFTTLQSTDNSEEPGSSQDPSKLPAFCTYPRGIVTLTQHRAVSWPISLTCCSQSSPFTQSFRPQIVESTVTPYDLSHMNLTHESANLIGSAFKLHPELSDLTPPSLKSWARGPLAVPWVTAIVYWSVYCCPCPSSVWSPE